MLKFVKVSAVIELNQVNIYQSKKLILENVNLTLNETEFAYLIGKTGSGKSSLLKILYGELPLTEGNGSVAGFDLKNYNYQDINKLFNAKIQIPSYSGRRFNKLQGSVFYVGSDIIIDQRMGFPYYLIKIMISKKELIEASKRKMKIFPGMEANVFILTEARTPLSYFISPISSAFDTAMIDS